MKIRYKYSIQCLKLDSSFHEYRKEENWLNQSNNQISKSTIQHMLHFLVDICILTIKLYFKYTSKVLFPLTFHIYHNSFPYISGLGLCLIINIRLNIYLYKSLFHSRMYVLVVVVCSDVVFWRGTWVIYVAITCVLLLIISLLSFMRFINDNNVYCIFPLWLIIIIILLQHCI